VFRSREDVDDFALRLSGLVQQLARHDDDDIDEHKSVEKYLRVAPKKYTQIALSMETLLDLSTMSIEEVTGQLKAVDDCEEAPRATPIFACSSPRSSDSLARRRRRSRMACLRPRIVVANRARRAVTAALTVEKGRCWRWGTQGDP
jgi:hypothetical protein